LKLIKKEFFEGREKIMNAVLILLSGLAMLAVLVAEWVACHAYLKKFGPWPTRAVARRFERIEKY